MGSQRPCRVLIVEDELDIRRVMGWLLESEGMQVQQVGHGKEAIASLTNLAVELPDVILLDLLMPVMGGEELLKWLKNSATPEVRKLPVIVTTGVSEVPESVYQNAQVVLKKPVDAARLLAAIQAVQEGTGDERRTA